MDQWQLGGIADENCVEENSVVQGVVQMPLRQASDGVNYEKYFLVQEVSK